MIIIFTWGGALKGPFGGGAMVHDGADGKPHITVLHECPAPGYVEDIKNRILEGRAT